MRLVLFWAFYEKYLTYFYNKNPYLSGLPYAQQLNVLLSDYFGWPPSLMRRVAEQGHEVEILIVNAESLQKAWAVENGVDFGKDWQFAIPLAQVKQFKPNVLWIGSMFQYFRGGYLTQLKDSCRRLFAWIACPLPSDLSLVGVDCVLTSHANFQEHFVKQGQASELLLPAFESDIAAKLTGIEKDIDCSFIGSVSYAHLKRMEVLKRLVKETPLTIWADHPKLISRGLLRPEFIRSYLSMGEVRRRMNPGVWGMDMYCTIAKSKICINVHVDVASGLAGNMRMFEVTGSGGLLLTEKAPNLHHLYEPDAEVVTYSSTNDLIEKINYYLSHPQEREAIAQSSQQRTLSDHSAIKRSYEFLEIVSRYL